MRDQSTYTSSRFVYYFWSQIRSKTTILAFGSLVLVDSVLWNYSRPSVWPFLCPSVHPSLCPSLSFLKIGSLFFFLITNDWRSQIFEKKKLMARMWAEWAKIGSEIRFFCHFLWFGSLVSLKIAYTEGLQLDITSSRGKTHKKKLGIKSGTKWAKIRPKITFFVIFSSLFNY